MPNRLIMCGCIFPGLVILTTREIKKQINLVLLRIEKLISITNSETYSLFTEHINLTDFRLKHMIHFTAILMQCNIQAIHQTTIFSD